MAKTKKETNAESTALVVLTPEEQAYLDSLKSEQAQAQGDYNGPNKLVINVSSKDKDGNKRPIGGWHITGTDKYFDGTVSFRPIRHMYKLIRYNVDDANNYTVAGQSIYFKDWGEDKLDSLGGTALGRKFGRNYTQEEKDATKKLAECYLDIFGFVSFGNEDEPENGYPVLYRVRGSKLMKMLNAFRAVPKDKQFSEYNYKIETFQPDGKQYWDITVTPDLSKRLPILPILSYDAEIRDLIAEDRLAVITSYKKHQDKKTEENLTQTNTKVVNSLDDNELPF